MEQLVLLGIALILVGFLLVFLGSVLAEKGNVRVGVGGFIGPIPFGFASDKQLLYLIIAVSLGLLLLSFFLSRA